MARMELLPVPFSHCDERAEQLQSATDPDILVARVVGGIQLVGSATQSADDGQHDGSSGSGAPTADTSRRYDR